MTRRCLALLLALCCTAAAQDAPKTRQAPKKKVAVKVLEAIVLEVKGVAQARPKKAKKWKRLEKNDTLAVGTVIRTGRKSRVALRVGRNATVIVGRQSRVAIPELVQDGQVLRTKLSLNFGKADVKVDRIGLVNDFEVSTPTATLAVRGSAVTIYWDAVNLFSAEGADARSTNSAT